MFKTPAFRLQMVKPEKPSKKGDDTTEKDPLVDFEKIDEIIRARARGIAVGFVTVYAAVRVIDTACEIAVNASPKKH